MSTRLFFFFCSCFCSATASLLKFALCSLHPVPLTLNNYGQKYFQYTKIHTVQLSRGSLKFYSVNPCSYVTLKDNLLLLNIRETTDGNGIPTSTLSYPNIAKNLIPKLSGPSAAYRESLFLCRFNHLLARGNSFNGIIWPH